MTGTRASHPLRLLLSVLLCLVAAAPRAQEASAGPNDARDPRKSYREGASPAWLRAIGRLEVPGIRYRDGRRRHHTERCSATLVSARGEGSAHIIVTAWHCLEFYEDLSKRIIFRLTVPGGNSLAIEATRLADGGGMDRDWAILRLQQSVATDIAPSLMPASNRSDRHRPLVMAGFSRDEGLGAEGSRLSYDPRCRIIRLTAAYTDSDCRAHKGASGGAVVQLDPAGRPRLLGVISQGDGDGLSRFIPVTLFRQDLASHIRGWEPVGLRGS